MVKKVIVQREIKVKKCNKCDKYGRVSKLNYPDRPECGSYSPFCDCEFGQYGSDHAEHRDMFCLARQGG